MSMSVYVGRIHCLRPSLPLNRSTPLASSIAPTQASPPNPHFAVEYLVQSCGLSSAEALRASEHILHLKSPEKPNSVLCFLREVGVSELDKESPCRGNLASFAPMRRRTGDQTLASYKSLDSLSNLSHSKSEILN